MTAIQKAQQQAPQVIDGDMERYDSNQGAGASILVAQTRAAKEVEAAMAVAKRYPRDEDAVYVRVMQACKRARLAEASQYEYPRGGQTITGPSIRLAETLARYWGNIRYGVVELERKRGQSQCLAFAWDLESNVQPTIEFSLRHERHTRQGIQILTDERDIMELILNQGSRRLRSCLLRVIPSDLVDDAIEQCNKTLASEAKGEPIAERAKKLAAYYADMGVTIEMIEAKLGHKISVMSESEYARLRRLWQAIKDGATTAPEAFAAQLLPSEKEEQKKSRVEQMKEKLRPQAEQAPRDDKDDPISSG
jgi:hypothetical protein